MKFLSLKRKNFFLVLRLCKNHYCDFSFLSFIKSFLLLEFIGVKRQTFVEFLIKKIRKKPLRDAHSLFPKYINTKFDYSGSKGLMSNRQAETFAFIIRLEILKPHFMTFAFDGH